ncbi:MAG: hypothetical protein JXQ80_00925 [Bacteroidales bacterium]|nr:hypothetical protein [Bacteroidales bacterium]
MISRSTTEIHKRCPYRFYGFLSVAFTLLLWLSPAVMAQEQDSLAAPSPRFIVDDSTAVDTSFHKHSPRTALVLSLICPGLGQAYNKKYWKIPFIYGAGGAFLYYVNYNQMKYTKFRKVYNDYTNDKNDGTAIIDGMLYYSQSYERGMNGYRRYRDLSVAGLAAIYLINAIDAMVDANFTRYDVSDDLSMKIEPSLIDNPGSLASVGFSFKITF